MRDIFLAFLMGLYDPRLQLSVARSIPRGKAHGVIHSAGSNGRIEQHLFLVDRPRLLSRPTAEILEQLFQQATALGFHPQHVEIFVGQRRQVFSDQGALVFAQ